MNELEEKRCRVRQYELDVRKQEIKVKEAKRDMEEGIDEAQAACERACNKVRSVYEQELVALEKEKQSLAFAIEDAKGFDGN